MHKFSLSFWRGSSFTTGSVREESDIQHNMQEDPYTHSCVLHRAQLAQRSRCTGTAPHCSEHTLCKAQDCSAGSWFVGCPPWALLDFECGSALRTARLSLGNLTGLHTVAAQPLLPWCWALALNHQCPLEAAHRRGVGWAPSPLGCIAGLFLLQSPKLREAAGNGARRGSLPMTVRLGDPCKRTVPRARPHCV